MILAQEVARFQIGFKLPESRNRHICCSLRAESEPGALDVNPQHRTVRSLPQLPEEQKTCHPTRSPGVEWARRQVGCRPPTLAQKKRAYWDWMLKRSGGH